MGSSRAARVSIWALWRSAEVRRSAGNAAYNIADYVTPPLLMLAATPVLVSRLGFEQYGVWMFVNAIVGTAGVVNFGLADATTKYVAAHRAEDDGAAVAQVVRSTLALYAILGLVVGILLAAAASVIVDRAFVVSPAYRSAAVYGLRLMGAGFMVRSVDAVFAAALRGLERYDLSARVSVSVKTASIVAAVVIVTAGNGVVAVIAAGLLLSACGVAVQAALLQRLVRQNVLWPSMSRQRLPEILHFGLYSWIQSIGGTAFSQVDRLLIASTLGARPLAYYTICVQLAQQVHALSAAGFNFVFPLISARSKADTPRRLRTLCLRCGVSNFVFAAILMLPLVVAGRYILTVWMGPAFAAESYRVLIILAVAFFMLAIAVVPHNVLLGLGQVRFVATSNLVGGLLATGAAVVLIPRFGLEGAAAARLLYGPAIAFNFLKVGRIVGWRQFVAH